MRTSLNLQLFIASLIISFFIYLPTVFVKVGFTPGDAAGNLYTIEAVSRGEVPYRDFLWVYGPLMLYYNALFFKLLGSSIQSAIWAKLLLETVFAGVFFLAARRIMPPLAALLATIAFSIFKPEFPHNFVHYGGVCIEIGILWVILSYCQKPKKKYILSGMALVVLLGFIKFNFGIFFLIGSLLCFILCDLLQHRNFSSRQLGRYGLYIIATLLIWFFVYYSLVRTLSWHQINQCFPLLKKYIYPGGGIIDGLGNLLSITIQNLHSNQNFEFPIAALAFVALIICIIDMILRSSFTIVPDRNFSLINIILLILTLCGYHEFIKSGLDYTASWAKPLTIMAIAYVVSEACVTSHAVLRVFIFIFIAVILGTHSFHNLRNLETFKKQEHFFESNHMNIYVAENPTDIKSMLDTVNYIKDNIPQDKLFFTFPLNAGYYYLTDRRMPVWFLYLLEVNKVSPAQEIEIIQSLEKQNVEYIVLPSIAYAGFAQFGKFGTTHGQLLAQYIAKYFEEVARFGQWSEVSEDYIGGMGTKILKKKVSQYNNIRSAADLN